MAFISLIRKIVGDPITKEWTDQIKDNLDDLDQRVNQSETTGGSVFILNSTFRFAGLDSSNPYIFYYKATQDFSVADFRVQIKSKGLITSGTLAFNLEKSLSATPSSFNSILSSDLTFNYATDAAYTEKTGSLNTSVTDIASGDILRVKVVSMPIYFGGEVMISIGGE